MGNIKSASALILTIIMTCILVLAMHSRADAAATTCHLFTKVIDFSEVSGYAPPYNIFSTAKEDLLTAVCDENSVTIKAGSTAPDFAVYNKGYVYSGSWQMFQFDPQQERESYLNTMATHTIDQAPTTTESFFVSYVCVPFGSSGYKCGCSDTPCTENKWQIQSYKKPDDPAPTAQPNPTPVEGPTGVSKELFDLVNEHRKTIGKQPFVWNAIIEREAAQHAKNIDEGKVPGGHQGQQGRVDTIIREVPEINSTCGEVVATYGDPPNALSAWLASTSGHKEMVESDFAYAGFSIIGSSAVGLVCE